MSNDLKLALEDVVDAKANWHEDDTFANLDRYIKTMEKALPLVQADIAKLRRGDF